MFAKATKWQQGTSLAGERTPQTLLSTAVERSKLGLGQLQQCNVERKNKEPKDTIGDHLGTCKNGAKQQ